MHGRVAADRGGGHQPAGAHHAARLGQGGDPVGAVGQVIERAQQQDRVGARVRQGQVACVAQPRGHARQGPGPLDVERDRVEQFDLVAVGDQPLGVHPGAAADVEHPGGW
ncbi:hypothetical protein OG719_26065 [Microbispora hainanensis]